MFLITLERCVSISVCSVNGHGFHQRQLTALNDERTVTAL